MYGVEQLKLQALHYDHLLKIVQVHLVALKQFCLIREWPSEDVLWGLLGPVGRGEGPLVLVHPTDT